MFGGSIATVRASALFASLFALSAAGCGAGAPGPETTLRAVAADLRRDVPAGADAPTDNTHAERRELASALEATTLERRALVTLPGRDGGTRSVILVEENGAMRVEAGVLGVSALDTPERAIAALHRALGRELTLGPGVLLVESQRRSWLEERTRYRDGTASPDALDVRVDGDHATALTPLGDQIELVREGAEWRVSSMRAIGFD